VERYIDDVIAPGAYRVVDREHGVIPMTDEPQPRRLGNRVMAIGTKGGRVKASTGYAFRRIQQDSQRIAESLEVHGHPWDVPRQSPWTATLDTLLLQIMYRRGGLSEEVFSRLFSRNPVGRLFRFLDEETAPVETIKLMATVPWGPSIAAWFRTKILG